MNPETWRDVIVRRIGGIADVVIIKDHGCFFEDTIFVAMVKQIAVIWKCENDLQIYKAIADQKKNRERILIVTDSQTTVPYEVEQKNEVVSLTACMLFPLLNPEMLIECSIETYDALFEQYRTQTELYYPLSKQKTKEFIIRALFNLDLANIDDESLISLLARIYLRHYGLPFELTSEIRDILLRKNLDWALGFPEESHQFWCRLSQEWASYVNGNKSCFDFSNPAMLTILPSLLSSGKIQKVNITGLKNLEHMIQTQPFSLIGVNFPLEIQQDNRPAIATKLELLEKWLNEPISPELWLLIAKQWGQIRYLQYASELKDESITEKISKVEITIEKIFRRDMLQHYDLLVTSSTYQNPLTVDKILGSISIQRDRKVALAVFDGMGMAEWEIVKDYLEKNSIHTTAERQVFATLPTITSFSRQAIFSGKQPNEFSNNIKNPKEEVAFKDFWTNSGSLTKEDVFFDRLSLDKKAIFSVESELLEAFQNDIPIIGIVFSFIDNLLHSHIELDVGKKLFHQSIRNFLKESCLADLFKKMIDTGYHIYITADHGSIFGTGNGYYGKPMLIETQGKRCLIYDRKVLAEEQQKNTDCSLFTSRFVPADNFVLFANGIHFFGNIKSREITHGGISIEEMIVPLCEVQQ